MQTTQFKVEGISQYATLFEIKQLIEKQRGIKIDQQYVTNIRGGVAHSGTTGGKESATDNQIMPDDKTMGELGLIMNGESDLDSMKLKLMIDTNPITIRVNLSHSIH